MAQMKSERSSGLRRLTTTDEEGDIGMGGRYMNTNTGQMTPGMPSGGMLGGRPVQQPAMGGLLGQSVGGGQGLGFGPVQGTARPGPVPPGALGNPLGRRPPTPYSPSSWVPQTPGPHAAPPPWDPTSLTAFDPNTTRPPAAPWDPTAPYVPDPNAPIINDWPSPQDLPGLPIPSPGRAGGRRGGGGRNRPPFRDTGWDPLPPSFPGPIIPDYGSSPAPGRARGGGGRLRNQAARDRRSQAYMDPVATQALMDRHYAESIGGGLGSLGGGFGGLFGGMRGGR